MSEEPNQVGPVESVRVRITLHEGTLTVEQVQKVLDDINVELSEPNSAASQELAKLGLGVRDVELVTNSPFVLETFLIMMAVHFAGGAASAGGALFFNKVIKPRFDREEGGAVRDVEVLPGPDGAGDTRK